MTEIKRITFEGLSTRPEFDFLVSEYADECQISGLPRCVYDSSTYCSLENQARFTLQQRL
jgi:hypothetical protein